MKFSRDGGLCTKTENSKRPAVRTAASSADHARCRLLPALVVVVPVARYALDRALALLQHLLQLSHLPLAGHARQRWRQHCTTGVHHTQFTAIHTTLCNRIYKLENDGKLVREHLLVYMYVRVLSHFNKWKSVSPFRHAQRDIQFVNIIPPAQSTAWAPA